MVVSIDIHISIFIYLKEAIISGSYKVIHINVWYCCCYLLSETQTALPIYWNSHSLQQTPKREREQLKHISIQSNDIDNENENDYLPTYIVFVREEEGREGRRFYFIFIEGKCFKQQRITIYWYVFDIRLSCTWGLYVRMYVWMNTRVYDGKNVSVRINGRRDRYIPILSY